MYVQLFSTFHEIHFWIQYHIFFVTFSLDIQQLYGSNNHVHKMEYPVPSTPIYPPIHYRVHFITIGYYDDHLERKNGLVWCR